MPLEPGANPGVCVKDRRDAVLFCCAEKRKVWGNRTQVEGKAPRLCKQRRQV
nr:MAG TPA: hypothetical protein [Caudoviricetes sp.]